MTKITGRLRWEPGEDGILFGYSGTLKPWVFAICPPGAPGDFWMISTSFPLGQPRYVGSEKEARNAAGRWLEEFVSSLGAVFADTLRAGIQSERDAQDQLAADHEESGHDWQTERAYGRVEALDGLLATVDRTTAATTAREKDR